MSARSLSHLEKTFCFCPLLFLNNEKIFSKNKTKLPLEQLHCGASLSFGSRSCSLFLPFKWLAESLNIRNRQLKTTQSVESKTWRCTFFTHLWLHFFFSQLDEGHTRKVHGFCQWRSYKNLNKQTKTKRFSGVGGGGRALSDGTALAFLLQVVLARLGGGHHVGCHLVDLARRLLEDRQPLTAAARLHLRAQDSVCRDKQTELLTQWMSHFIYNTSQLNAT